MSNPLSRSRLQAALIDTENYIKYAEERGYCGQRYVDDITIAAALNALLNLEITVAMSEAFYETISFRQRIEGDLDRDYLPIYQQETLEVALQSIMNELTKDDQ